MYRLVVEEISTGTARLGEARQILDLQYLCFRSQAAVYEDWAMPPLIQTLGELVREYGHKKILVARIGDEVVGSVRAGMEGETCHISRLMVHPERQGSGLGERLMREIEAEFSGAGGFELFTGHRSEANLRLYRRLGYETYAEEAASEKVTLIHMRKPGLENGPGRRG